MSHQELIQRLMKTFVLELREHVGTLNENLLALEKATTDAQAQTLINSLFRAAHSLKGAARSVELIPLEALSHHIEELFVALRNGQLRPSPALTQLLFCAVDAIEQTSVPLEAGDSLPENSFVELCESLAQALSEPVTAQAPWASQAADAGAPQAAAEQRALSPPAASAAPSGIADSIPAAKAATAAVPDTAPPEPDASGAGTRVQVSAAQLDRILTRSSEFRIACLRYEERAKTLEPLIAGMRAHLQLGATSSAQHLRSADALVQQLDELAVDFRADAQGMRAASLPLDAELQQLRLVPFRQVCEGLQRVVRDLAVQSGKQVELLTGGEELEIDRSLVSVLRQAVLQLVRNAVSHGLETADRRREAGKPARGRLRVQARLEGTGVIVSVEDDGQGLDSSAIRASASRLGIAIPEDERAHETLVFMPGISSVAAANAVSGRGVGLDVVKTAIERARGTVTVQSQRHHSTCFVLSVPLSLSTLQVLLIRLGTHAYALEITRVEQMLKVAIADLVSIRGQQRVLVGSASLPVLDLKTLLGIGQQDLRTENDSLHLVIVRSGGADTPLALAVDDVLGIEDILLKPLGPRLAKVPYVHGVTLDRHGCPVPVLNLRELIGDYLGGSIQNPAGLTIGISAAQKKHRLLVVDDSATTRLLEENILRDAGFEVLSAVDGAQAWQMLNQHSVDLVVSDVQMPGMDGIELTTAIRASIQHQELAVILLTARDSEEDRLNGMNAGADAYLVKSAFELDALIQTIQRLLM
ncbi:hybrid sensor histidine kinase/response regulator [Marinobacterium rhizophilum]|uniref:histidine kinase n=1 Tax=Marinobacterium rhizophilum TaxID=420402 RepID=A0ABY5HCI4_9GAMM|nr:response regulator [Marinobacterium rhizophilum]UTW10066.1 response regulator [Marinobacterium rhizophilum]